MSTAIVLFDELTEEELVNELEEEGYQSNRLGVETDNFLIVWADGNGLHRHHTGPGPWEQVIEAMGKRVDRGNHPLRWTRMAVADPEEEWPD